MGDHTNMVDGKMVLQEQLPIHISKGRAIFVTKEYVKKGGDNGFRLMMWSGKHGDKSVKKIYEAAPISTKGREDWSQILRFDGDEARSAWINSLKKACATRSLGIGFKELKGLMLMDALKLKLRKWSGNVSYSYSIVVKCHE